MRNERRRVETVFRVGLPVSTVVGSLVLQAVTQTDDLKSALDKLETDLAAVKREVLSA